MSVAKQRSGLGRGLGSLLGGELDNGLPQEQPSTEAKEIQEKVEEKAQENEPVKAPPAPPHPESIYTNKEDNITIKEVVEREARPAQKSRNTENEGVLEVAIDSVEPNPYQPRKSFKKEDLEELAQSIKKNGLLQPILVRKVGDTYQIIAGERRWQACKSLGMKKVPVIVKEAGDDETIVLALIENIQRSNLNPIEEAYGYKGLMERRKMTQSEVAQAVSKGRTTITNALRLLELPEDAQQLLYEEKITAGHARAILSVPTKEGRRKLTDKLVEEKLSVRDAERIARLLAGKTGKTETVARPPAPKSYKTVARALSDALNSEVKIKSTQGKNKIEISFKDEADLQRLYRAITESK